jgi:hypothetical protein
MILYRLLGACLEERVSHFRFYLCRILYFPLTCLFTVQNLLYVLIFVLPVVCK